jgi:hypothetical protein
MMLQTQFVFAKSSNDILGERVSGAMRDKIRRGDYAGKPRPDKKPSRRYNSTTPEGCGPPGVLAGSFLNA